MPFAQDRFFILLNVHCTQYLCTYYLSLYQKKQTNKKDFVKCLKQLCYYEASQHKFWEPNSNDIGFFHFGFWKQVEN